jgi:hypothetical protein
MGISRFPMSNTAAMGIYLATLLEDSIEIVLSDGDCGLTIYIGLGVGVWSVECGDSPYLRLETMGIVLSWTPATLRYR